ncbi:MAG TPA: M48 family metallopeptidase [Myxococcaceae bacterium]|nr:M48 family metallopeptidase [Myxococcaceae bacterium]
MKEWVQRSAWMLAAMVVVGGCSAAQRAGASKGVASVLISDEQEIQIGKQVKAELEKDPNFRYVEDPAVVDYVTRLATPILQSANEVRRAPWKLHVVDDDKVVNAFATPGGFLYIYTGLILAADNEAELAGVLGHEAAHVTERHSARALVNQYGIQAVTALALGENANLLGQITSTIAGQGLMLANSRSAENEADRAGAHFSNGGGYDPRGLATFFEKLKAEQGSTPGILAFLSTHPDPGDRVQNVNRIIQEDNLKATGGRSPGRLEEIKARIRNN